MPFDECLLNRRSWSAVGEAGTNRVSMPVRTTGTALIGRGVRSEYHSSGTVDQFARVAVWYEVIERYLPAIDHMLHLHHVQKRF
jgi:hypothetical protein